MKEINRRDFIIETSLASAALSGLGGVACGTREAGKPNFVFILVDDLGFMDISPNNPDCFYETPNLDRLASQGVRFTDGYASNPVCSPTRYSIMTGKYPTRIKATNFFSGRREEKFKPAPLHDNMPLSEVTLGEAFKSAGYRTAFLGKWHLGPTEEFWPEAQGFDINVGGCSRGMPSSFFSPYENPKLQDGPEGEYLTQRLTDESLKILDEFRNDPFLLYLAFYTVHIPLEAPEEVVEKYRKKAEALEGEEFAGEEQIWPTDDPRRVRIQQKHATYAAMVECMDAQVGRVLDKLEELDLDDNTVICFMSDNGGLSTAEGMPTSNQPLRAGKGWLYEGGIREPFIIKWPGSAEPGSTCSEPVISTDFYPTLLEIAGLPAQPEKHQDGVSLVPLLTGKGPLHRDALFWHYPHYSNQGGFPGGAVRQGDFKLIERFEDGKVQLYNLDLDIGEKNDLADSMPGKVLEMRQLLHAWYKSVDAEFLYPREETGELPWRPDTDGN
ncbi:MAG: sulfatase [Acidobacteriota bacterium]